ncbi:MAG: transcription antitermination factor NusB, partial [Gemmobacter sp.]
MAGTARKAAVRLLGAVLDGRQLLSQTEDMLSGLAPADRARAQRLCAQTLRHLEQADRVLKPLLRKAPPAEVLNVLRLSVVELAMGEAAHGVVNEAVGMVRADRYHAALSGLVNAVLRKVAALPAPFAKLPPQRLPYWLRKPLVDTYGREVVSAIEAVQAQPAPIDLTLRADRPVPEGAQHLPSGSLRLPAGTQVSALEGYAEGSWWVQDAAAAMAVALLDPRP